MCGEFKAFEWKMGAKARTMPITDVTPPIGTNTEGAQKIAVYHDPQPEMVDALHCKQTPAVWCPYSAELAGSISDLNERGGELSHKSNTTDSASKCSSTTGPESRSTEMSEKSPQHSLGLATSSAAGSRARTSLSRESVQVLTEIVAGSGSSSTVSLLKSLPHGLLSRTSLACYPATTDETWESSFEGWKNSGMGGPTGCLTLNTSE